jgi:hypothetical protein
MKLSRKLPVLAAALALTTVGATAAMAMEHQFNGAFTTYYDLSNFSASGAIQKDAPTSNYFEQRARLGYSAKASNDLKLVTMFEIDYGFWGNSSYDGPGGRNQGGAIGADTVNIETKSIYLNWSIPSANLNAKIGMQPYDDSFKGIFVGADMPGILLTHSYANASASAGFFRWNDTGATLGKNTRDMFVLDGKYNLTKETQLGAAYYFVNSDNISLINLTAPEDVTVHMLGVNGSTKVGAVAIDGFLAYQFGKDNFNNNNRSAFAGNVGANVPVGKGTARTEFLYVSGDKDNSSRHSFYTPYSQKFAQFKLAESGFYNNEMVILGRDKNAMTNDNSIVFDANNNNQGVIFGSVGYDYPLSSKLNGSVNAGFAAVAKENSGSHKSSYLGTEANAELVYSFTDNLKMSTRAAYVVLGDYFTSNVDDPYDFKLLLKYNF